MKQIEDNNTLVFVVERRATKPQIKVAVKKLYDIEAVHVNTLILSGLLPISDLHVAYHLKSPDGKKKAFVKLSAETDALEIANKVCCDLTDSPMYIHFAADRNHLSGHVGHTGNESVSQYGC